MFHLKLIQVSFEFFILSNSYEKFFLQCHKWYSIHADQQSLWYFFLKRKKLHTALDIKGTRVFERHMCFHFIALLSWENLWRVTECCFWVACEEFLKTMPAYSTIYIFIFAVKRSGDFNKMLLFTDVIRRLGCRNQRQLRVSHLWLRVQEHSLTEEACDRETHRSD